MNDGRIIATSRTVTVSGTVSVATYDGVYLSDAGSRLDNSGTITASLYAAHLTSGGDLTNSGVLYGGKWGVSSRGLLSITNTGTISGASQGIVLSGGGHINNSKLISGQDGVGIGGARGTVVNTGTVTSYGDAVYLGAGGTVGNTGTGLISSGGRYAAVGISGGSGSVTHAGTLSGYIGVSFLSTYNNTLIDSGTIIGSLAGASAAAVTFGGGNDDSAAIPAPRPAPPSRARSMAAPAPTRWSSPRRRAAGTLTGQGAYFIEFLQGHGRCRRVLGAWPAATRSGSSVSLTDSATLTVVGSVVNDGTINEVGGATFSDDGGTIVNGSSTATSALITAAGVGIATSVGAPPNTITNYGTIAGAVGIRLGGNPGGTVNNRGTISGVTYGGRAVPGGRHGRQ